MNDEKELERKPGASPPASTTMVENAQHKETVSIDPVVERSLVRKVDRILMPLVMIAYLLAFLDRSNIGNAQTAGMGADLGLSDAQYQWLLTIFYIPYILFEWGSLLWKLVPPHILGTITMFTWGLAATLQAVASNWAGLMTCRWFLAMNEAIFTPSMPYLMSFFYKRREIGVRIGIFLSAAPLSSCFAGALAYGITHANDPQIANWRLLFLVQGLPTVVMSAVVFYLMPDSADRMRFLTQGEKEVAKARSHAQTGKANTARTGKIELRQIWQSLLTVQTWAQGLMYFGCNVSVSSLPVFLPTILTGMGFNAINSQGLTAPPYFLSFLLCIASTYIGDKTRQRGIVIIVMSLLAAAGFVILAVTTSTAARYTAVFMAAGGLFPAVANILPWSLANQGTDTKRGTGIMMLNIIGQCGPLLGTRVFPASDGPYYRRGMWVSCGFMFLVAFLAVGLRTHFWWQNERLERLENEVQRTSGAEVTRLDGHIGGEKIAGDVRRDLVEDESMLGYRYAL